jgi:ribonuclease Z
MFENALAEDAHEKKHMTAAEAAHIAAGTATGHPTDVKKLALIHYSPRYTDHELKNLLKEAQKIFPNTVLTRDRSVFPLEYID